jgi:NAD(P)-dependent dehydrogenase (short-subunit alcohol dehydrogenase family)
MASNSKRIAIVTGANTGLGLHLVKSLYSAGLYETIVMACRSSEKAQKAIDEILVKPATTSPSGTSELEPPSSSSSSLKFIQVRDACGRGIGILIW